MDINVETIYEQIRPLIAPLSAEERLALIQAIANTEVASSQEDMLLREQAAWFALPSDERRKYHNEFVAISGGKVVDHNPDQRALYLRVNERSRKAPVLILNANWDEPPTFTIHSPQLDT